MIVGFPIEILSAIFEYSADVDLAILAFMPEFRDVASNLLQKRGLATIDSGRVSISVDAMAGAEENQLQWMENHAEFGITQQIIVLLTWDAPIYMNKLTEGEGIKDKYIDDLRSMVPYFVNNLSRLPNCGYIQDERFLRDLFKYIGKNWKEVEPVIHADIGELLEIALESFEFIDSTATFHICIKFHKCEIGKKLYQELFMAIENCDWLAAEFVCYAIKNNLIAERPVYNILNSARGDICKYVTGFEGGKLILKNTILKGFECKSQEDIEWWLTLVNYINDNESYTDSDSDSDTIDYYPYKTHTNFFESSKGEIARYAYKHIQDIEILNKIVRYTGACGWLSYAIDNNNIAAFRVLVRNCFNYERRSMRKIIKNQSLLEIFLEEAAK